MKLEKVVSRPKPGRWVILFIIGLAVAGAMATMYNVELAHNVNFEGIPWGKIVFGAVGFIGIIVSLALLFARLLREMRVSQIQADFLDRISHELRTPLATLTLVGDLLRQETQIRNSDQEKLWASHDLELQRLKTDVELLLQAARLRESKLKVNLERINLAAWIENRWTSLVELLGSGATLKLIQEGDVWVSVDPSLLELIVRNLIDNARKFAIGAPVVEIQIRSKQPYLFFGKGLFGKGLFGKRRWVLVVRDQGLGFLPGQEAVLFRRFSRLDGNRRTQVEHSIPGTGLGLYLSASACKAMNLTLVGRSLGEKKGAEFKIEGVFA